MVYGLTGMPISNFKFYQHLNILKNVTLARSTHLYGQVAPSIGELLNMTTSELLWEVICFQAY